MQDCFRLHPDIYSSELDDDEIDAQLEDHIASEAASEAPSDTSVLTDDNGSPKQQKRTKRVSKTTATGETEPQNQSEPGSRVLGQGQDITGESKAEIETTSENLKK